MIGNHTALSVYVPLLMAVVLGAMTYFHWHHRLKYLYLAALLLLLVYAITSAIYVSHSAGYNLSASLIKGAPLLWRFVCLGGIVLFFVSVGCFVYENGSFKLFFKIVSCIGIGFFMLCGFYSFFFIMAGLASLKSG
ncbi:hypothetical protein J5A70_11050 [Prevotella nigrescens]|nr:hypothetical protein J5A70_11050 [Prevotella nigrescens]QUB51105.1 hypothetical protein J5A59_01145 [Prevotella nigrescens]UAK29686.1 hypothetical protein K8O81_10925 [Prevotella nigrescens]